MDRSYSNGDGDALQRSTSGDWHRLGFLLLWASQMASSGAFLVICRTSSLRLILISRETDTRYVYEELRAACCMLHAAHHN